MRYSIFVLPILFTLIAGSGGLAFAENSFNVKIPTGASYQNADKFWILSSGDRTDNSIGDTTGEITVYPGDSITWHNADDALHTITSVSASSIETGDFEEDGVFDSGIFTKGKSYTNQFDDLGDFHYYCILHTWMNGVVHVTKNPGSVQTIDNIGSGYSENGLGFEVKYILDTNLQKAVHVNPDDKSLTFRISGTSENEQITFVLPSELIESPNAVLVDGEITNFESEITSSGTKLVVPISSDTNEIKIMGTKVIPEFGFLAISILSISILSILFLTRSKLSMFR
jgi:predicted secreted protein with PEFG-CTERM motif